MENLQPVIYFATYSCAGVLESIGLSWTSQYHRQALTGIFEWNGQTFPPLRPPAYLLVRLVDEVNSGRIGEGNDGGVAVYGGIIPGVYRAGEARRYERRPLRAHRDLLCVRQRTSRGCPRAHADLAAPPGIAGDVALW